MERGYTARNAGPINNVPDEVINLISLIRVITMKAHHDSNRFY